MAWTSPNVTKDPTQHVGTFGQRRTLGESERLQTRHPVRGQNPRSIGHETDAFLIVSCHCRPLRLVIQQKIVHLVYPTFSYANVLTSRHLALSASSSVVLVI